MSILEPIILFGAIFGIMYLLIIRPQRRRAMEAASMQSALAPGDDVVTSGGIYGTITEVEDGGTVLLEISEDTEIRIATSAVTAVVKDSDDLPTTDMSSQSDN